MFDSFNREIRSLRISVTDRCDLHCLYCRPGGCAVRRPASEILSFEQILRVVSAALDLGIRRVRLTGGEPLLRKGLADLIAKLKDLGGLEDLALTTNGQRLEALAPLLRQAGLDRINLSLDSLDPGEYRRITGGGELDPVLRGIESARAAGFPLKINMVVLPGTTEGEIRRMEDFCRAGGMVFQPIRHYDLREDKPPGSEEPFRRPPDCRHCDRLRLLSTGSLKPCLHSDDEIPLDWEDLPGSLRRAVEAKPAAGGHCLRHDPARTGG